MENYFIPTRESLKKGVLSTSEFIKNNRSFFSRVFSQYGPEPLAYIDEDWYDKIHSKIENVLSSDLYKGDGTLEHRIAYISVDINLRHEFTDGNKRSSLFVLLFLSIINDIDPNIMHEENGLYNFTKKVAREGGENRDKNIIMLREMLKDKQ